MNTSNTTLHQILKKLSPKLDTVDFNSFFEICHTVSLKNKEAIIEANQKTSKAFFILKGMIRGYLINKEGVEKNIFLRPAHTFMGAPNALFNEERSRYTFEAIGDTVLVVFPLQEFEELAIKRPALLKLYIAGYKEMIQTMVVRIESMINSMPEQRYEELLQRSPQFFQIAYHKDIANYLGISPVSLSRIIKRTSL